MKSIEKILLTVVLIFFGITLIYTPLNKFGFNKYISEMGDEAIKSEDLSFFRGRFSYYKEADLINEKVELENISFNIYMFLQATTNDYNFLSVVVEDLKMENAGNTLKINIKTSGDDMNFDLLKIGKENWYLQWIQLNKKDIKQIKITHPKKVDDQEVILYQTPADEIFLTAQDTNLSAIVKKENSFNSVVYQTSSTAIDNKPSESSKLEKSKARQVKFNVELAKDVNVDALYIVGNFNNWLELDNTYKLAKNKKTNSYSGTFMIETDYEDIQYKIITSDKSAVVDAEGNVVYHSRVLIDSETFELEDFGISYLKPYNFTKYNYFSWLGLGVYIVLIFLIIWLVKLKKKPKIQPIYTKPQEKTQKEQESYVELKPEDIKIKDEADK